MDNLELFKYIVKTLGVIHAENRAIMEFLIRTRRYSTEEELEKFRKEWDEMFFEAIGVNDGKDD